MWYITNIQLFYINMIIKYKFLRNKWKRQTVEAFHSGYIPVEYNPIHFLFYSNCIHSCIHSFVDEWFEKHIRSEKCLVLFSLPASTCAWLQQSLLQCVCVSVYMCVLVCVCVCLRVCLRLSLFVCCCFCRLLWRFWYQVASLELVSRESEWGECACCVCCVYVCVCLYWSCQQSHCLTVVAALLLHFSWHWCNKV